jgi:hypothetical protein
MYDARMFQDLVSMDSIYLEFGHEDALDYFFDRPENNHWLPDSNEAKQFMAAVLPANEQTDRDSLSDLSWARLNRKRKYQEVIESYHNSQSPLSPLSLAQLAIAARDSNQLELCQQLMEQFVNQPNSTPENNLLHFFSATVLLSSSLDSAKIESRKTIEWCNVFSSNITEKAGNYTSLQKLLQSWYLLQSKKFTDSNIDYHNYLSLDPTLDFSFLLYRLTGWFVMR